MPELKHPLQGKSLAKIIRNKKVKEVNEYIISENWSQATIITKEYKLGLMLDPTEAKPGLDFREFGDMFFIRDKDRLEVVNEIGNSDYEKEINRLKSFYDEFTNKIPDTGKKEVTRLAKEKMR